MKTAKRNLVTLLMFFVMCLSLLLGTVFAVPAKAANENGSVAQNGFYMDKGASVKVETEGAGIRFTTFVEKTWYEALLEQYDGYTATFHTLVSSATDDITTLTPNTKNVSDKAIDQKPVFDDKGVFTYYGIISYNNLTPEQLVQASKTELSARAYVELTKAESDAVIVYAKAEDTTRSIRIVANGLLISGNYECETSDLTKYLGTVTEKSFGGNYETYENAGDITVKGVPVGTYEGYVGSEYVGEITLTGDGQTVNVENLSALKAGEECTLSLFATDNSVYRVPFKSVTKVITTAQELANIVDYSTKSNETTWTGTNNATFTYDGYFVLGNSIDLNEYCVQGSVHIYKSAPYTKAAKNGDVLPSTYGFAGTFDGQGYTIYGGVYDDGGLFGAIAKTGVVKNVALVGLSKYAHAVFGRTVCGTVDNVLIDVETQLSANAVQTVFAGSVIGGSYSNIVIRYNGTSDTHFAFADYTYDGRYDTNYDLVDASETVSTSNIYVFTNQGYNGNYANNAVHGGIVRKTLSETCASAGLAESATGFNSYWNFDGERPLFDSSLAYTNKVEVALTKTTEYELYSKVENGARVENAAFVLDLSEEFTIPAPQDTVWKLGATDITADVTVDSGVITVANLATTVNGIGGEFTLTGTGEYFSVTAPLLLLNKKLMNPEDLENMVNYSTKSNETTWTNGNATFTYEGYFVLGGNIQLGTNSISKIAPYTAAETNTDGSMPKKYGFAGVFDGRGYTIIGGKYDGGGLFGTVSENGVVKNVALVGMNKISQHGVLGYTVNGTVDNVLIDVESSTSSGNREVSIANHILGGSFSNIIVRMSSINTTYSYAWTEYMLGPVTDHSAINDVDPTTNNVCLISDCKNIVSVWKYPMNVGVTQQSDMTKTCAELGLTESASGFNSYWDFSGNKPAFDSWTVADQTA